MEVKLNNYIIFDNKAYKELPGRVSSNMSMFGVSFDTRASLNGSTVRVVRPVVTDNIYETTPRLSKYNIIELNWDSNTFTTVCMVDQLNVLAKANKPFMFMFDNEFSNTDDSLVKLSDVEYLLPTYPLAHLKQTVNNSVQYDYAIDVKINGVDAGNSNSYYINNTTGSIIFSNALLATDVVTATYKWSIWCKINNISHKNIGNIARNAYELSVILEQLDFPDNITEDAYKYVVSDCRECPIDSPVVSDNNPGDDDPDDETSTEICTIPTIFNNDGTNIVSGSSNQWVDYTGILPFTYTLDNHRYSDGNTVGTIYPIHIFDKPVTNKTRSDILQLSGVTITDVPADRLVSKIYVELDLVTENNDTCIDVLDRNATITINSNQYSLAKYENIKGSKTVRYECVPSTRTLTDSVIDNNITFDYQIESRLVNTQREILGYEVADWSITVSPSLTLTSPNSSDPYNAEYTITGTYVGNPLHVPSKLDFLVEQEIRHSFSYSLGTYTKASAEIDCGLGYVKRFGLSNQAGNTFTFRQQKVFNLNVTEGVFTLTVPVSVVATTEDNGSVISYKTEFEIINSGVVRPENGIFDLKKLFDLEPVSGVTPQWTKTTNIRYFVELGYYDTIGTSYGEFTHFYPGSTSPSMTNKRVYDERRIGDIEYSYTYTGAGAPPPYLIIKADFDFRCNVGNNVIKNLHDLYGWGNESIYINDKLDIQLVNTYTSMLNYNATANIDMRTKAAKTGYKLVKIPVVNGVAKFYVYDTDIRAKVSSKLGPITSYYGGTTSHLQITHYAATANIPARLARTVRIDQARVGVCWIEPVDNGDKGVTNELQSYEFSPSSQTTTTSTASTALVEKTFTFDDTMFTSLSDDTYTVGAEVSSFITQYDSPVNSTINTAVAKAKLSYVASSVGFVEYVKSAQNVDNTSHHNTGFIDTTNDKIFGGLYDYFGKTQPDLNKSNIIANDGLVVYAKFNQTTPVGLVFTSGHYTLGTTVTATGGFSSGYTLVSGNTNGYGGTPGATMTWTGSSTSGRGEVNSSTLIEVTNTNVGTLSPKYIYLTVNSTCYYSYTCTSHKSIIYDGFAYSTYATTNPNTSVNSVKVKVPLGPDKKGYYLLNQGVIFDIVGATSITASTGVVALIASQQEAPDITDVKIKLHTVLPSSTDGAVFRGHGGWAGTPYTGTNGNIFRSSDGTATLAYLLELNSPYGLDLPAGSTDIVTGIEITCDAKSVTGAPLSDTLLFRYLYGPSSTYSSDESVVLTNLTGTKQKLTVGGNTNLFGGTPTVADILDDFRIEIEGTNTSGKILQLSNIRAKIYYVKLQ